MMELLAVILVIVILGLIVRAVTWKNDTRQCINCGRSIREPYTRCYRCHRMSKRAGWHDPEELPELTGQDARLSRAKFYVYVLDTDYGQYVGHSGNIHARMNAHLNGEVPSTANGNPAIIWVSHPCATRHDAARFEAALKSWRDNRKARFTEVTGSTPVPFWRG